MPTTKRAIQQFRASLTEIERKIYDHLEPRHRAYMALFRREAASPREGLKQWEFQLSKKDIAQIVDEPYCSITTVQRRFVRDGLMKLVLLGGKSPDGSKFWASIYEWKAHTLTTVPAKCVAVRPQPQPEAPSKPHTFTTPEPYRIKGILGAGEIMAIETHQAGVVPAISQLVACISAGEPWLGHETQQGRVLVLTARHNPNIAPTIQKAARAMGFTTVGEVDIMETRNIEDVTASIVEKRYDFIILNQYLKLFKWGDGNGNKFHERVSKFIKAVRCSMAVVEESSYAEQLYLKHGAVFGDLSLKTKRIRFMRHDQPGSYGFKAKFRYPIFKRNGCIR